MKKIHPMMEGHIREILGLMPPLEFELKAYTRLVNDEAFIGLGLEMHLRQIRERRQTGQGHLLDRETGGGQ